MQVFVTISPSPSPAAIFYWRGNNISASNDRLEIYFKYFTSAFEFQLSLSAGSLVPTCFCQRNFAHCLSEYILFSPVLLLVSPLNNLMNVHAVPDAPDVWVILIQILQLFCVYPLAYLFFHRALHKPWGLTYWAFIQRKCLHGLVLPLVRADALCRG